MFDIRNPQYAQSGHIVFGGQNALLAVPFDPGLNRVSGAATRVIDEVQMIRSTGAAHYALSDRGHLLFLSSSHAYGRQLAWVDFEGAIRPLIDEQQAYSDPSISPDGSRVAIILDNADVYIIDVTRGARTRLTFDAATKIRTLWKPDGQSVVYSSSVAGAFNLFLSPVDGSADPVLLLSSDFDIIILYRNPTCSDMFETDYLEKIVTEKSFHIYRCINH